jgi:hypothetical protein
MGSRWVVVVVVVVVVAWASYAVLPQIVAVDRSALVPEAEADAARANVCYGPKPVGAS